VGLLIFLFYLTCLVLGPGAVIALINRSCATREGETQFWKTFAWINIIGPWLLVTSMVWALFNGAGGGRGAGFLVIPLIAVFAIFWTIPNYIVIHNINKGSKTYP
jgi:hypothetical protein